MDHDWILGNMKSVRLKISKINFNKFQTQSERHHRSRFAASSHLHGNTTTRLENGGSRSSVQRRARSEGPINRRPRWKVASFRDDIRPAMPTNSTPSKSIAGEKIYHQRQVCQEKFHTLSRTKPLSYLYQFKRYRFFTMS